MAEIHTIIIHCSSTKPDWMDGETLWQKRQEIRRWHVNGNGWSDIGYHWLIDRDGVETNGREWTVQGAHVRGHNQGTVGICLIGGHGSAAKDDFRDHFTADQEEALIRRIEWLRRKFPSIREVTGHNQYAAKACPGFHVPTWYPQARKDYLTGDLAPEVAPQRPFDVTAVRAEIADLRESIGRAKVAVDRLEGML